MVLTEWTGLNDSTIPSEIQDHQLVRARNVRTHNGALIKRAGTAVFGGDAGAKILGMYSSVLAGVIDLLVVEATNWKKKNAGSWTNLKTDLTTGLTPRFVTAPYPDGTDDETGTATGADDNSLEDTAQAWTENQWAGHFLLLKTGTGAGQIKKIVSNTATVLRVDDEWDINPDGTTTYAIQDVEEVVILANGTDAPQAWDGTNAPAAVAGISATAKYIAMHNSRLWLVATNSNQIDFSNINNPAYIYNDDNISFKEGSGYPINGIYPFREWMAIFTENSMGVISGATTEELRLQDSIQNLSVQIGCANDRTIQQVNTELVFLSRQGLMSWRPQNFTEDDFVNLSKDISATMARINWAYISVASAIYDPEAKEYRISLPLDDSTTANFTLIVHLDRQYLGNDGKMYYGITLDDYADDPTSWVLHIVSGVRKPYFGGSAGYVVEADASSYSDVDSAGAEQNYIYDAITKYLDLPALSRKKRYKNTYIEGKAQLDASDCQMYIVIDGEEDGTLKKTVDLQRNGFTLDISQLDIDSLGGTQSVIDRFRAKKGRLIGYRLRNDQAGQQVQINKIVQVFEPQANK